MLIVLVAYIVYAGIYIAQSSIVIGGQRYFVLFDDAMISMRYARNLTRGEGLVWNPGERVEGYSNPLWVLIMAVVHIFPIPIHLISLPVQILGGLFLLASLVVVKKIGDTLSGTNWVGLLATLLTAFYAPLSTWSLLGMEVSVAILITLLAIRIGIRLLRREATFTGWLYVLLGIGTLLRLDMLVQFLAVWSFLLWADVPNRRRHLLWGGGMLLLFLGGQTLWRWAYYGELLPNTYYLKVNGASVPFLLKNGWFVFLKFVWNFNPVFFWLPLVVVVGLTVRRVVTNAGNSMRNKWLFPVPTAELAPGLLAWVFLAGCAYSIYVGGDAWEEKGGANRFISTGIPLLFLLLAYTLSWWKKQRREDRNILSGFGSLALTYIALVNLRYIAYPDDLIFWNIAHSVLFIVVILATLALAFPRLRHGLMIGGVGVYIVYFIIEGVVRRHELAADILPGMNGVTILQMLFNMLKVTVKLFVGGNAPLFLLPLVVIAWIIISERAGRKVHFLKSAGNWLIWGMVAWALLVRLPNPEAWINLGGLNKVLSAYLPLGMLLIAEVGPQSPSGRWRKRAYQLGSLGLQAGIAALCLVSSNALLDASSLDYWALLKRHPFIPGSERYLQISLAIEPVLGPQARIAVVTAGIIPYFTDRPAIDLLGKCDPVVARTSMHITDDMPLLDYRPGHMKWEYSYSLGLLQPDLVVQLYGGYHNPDTLAYLDNYSKIYLDDFPMFVLNDSSEIVWENIPADRTPANP